MAGVGEDEFLYFDGGLLSVEIIQEDAGDFIGEAFDKFEGFGGAELGDPLRDVVVIDRVRDVVGLGGAGEIAGDFDGDEEALRLGTFFIGHPDFAENAEVFDGDGIHFQETREDTQGAMRRTV